MKHATLLLIAFVMSFGCSDHRHAAERSEGASGDNVPEGSRATTTPTSESRLNIEKSKAPASVTAATQAEPARSDHARAPDGKEHRVRALDLQTNLFLEAQVWLDVHRTGSLSPRTRITGWPRAALATDVDALRETAKHDPIVRVYEQGNKGINEQIAKQIAEKVDFAKENIVWVEGWSAGPPFGALEWETKGGKEGVLIGFYVKEALVEGQASKIQEHVSLFAVPKTARVAFGRIGEIETIPINERGESRSEEEVQGILRSGGKHWNAASHATGLFDEKIQPGDQLWIWLAKDRVWVANAGVYSIPVQWQIRPGKKQVGGDLKAHLYTMGRYTINNEVKHFNGGAAQGVVLVEPYGAVTEPSGEQQYDLLFVTADDKPISNVLRIRIRLPNYAIH
jgi:hypothetical protein